MTILETKQVCMYFGGLKAVEQVDMQVEKGEIFGVIGPNGAGKTTFFNVCSGNYAATHGDVFLKGEAITGIRPEQITISREKTDAAQVEARVYAGMPAGSETLVSVRVGEKLITVKELGSTHYAGDETVYLSYPPKKVNVFDASTKRLIKYSR